MKRFWISSCFVLLALSLSLTGCKSDSLVYGKTPYFDDHWNTLKPQQKAEVYVGRKGRPAKRLSIQHLEKIIPRLFDGITWQTVHRDGRKENLFKKFARSLGKADYVNLTENNTEATPLFLKFMDDMASNVCKQAVDKDLKTPDQTKRIIIRHERDIDTNLRFLRMKLHTVYVPPNSQKGIKKLRALYDQVQTKTQNRNTAWQMVCITMLTDPAFLVY